MQDLQNSHWRKADPMLRQLANNLQVSKETRSAKAESDGDFDDFEDDQDDYYNFTSTITATSSPTAFTSTITAISSPTAFTSASVKTSPAAQTINNSSLMLSALSGANNSISSEHHRSSHESDAALVGTILGAIGGVILTVLALFAVKYFKKRRSHQRIPEGDQNFASSSRSERGSVIWGGSVANTEYHPPLPPKEVWYKPSLVKSMGNRVSKLRGGSEDQSSPVAPTPSEHGWREKTSAHVPPLPLIPAVYRPPVGSNSPATPSKNSRAPPVTQLESNASTAKEERLARVRDDPPNGISLNRQSTATIPGFKTAEAWVADQTDRLQRGA